MKIFLQNHKWKCNMCLIEVDILYNMKNLYLKIKKHSVHLQYRKLRNKNSKKKTTHFLPFLMAQTKNRY